MDTLDGIGSKALMMCSPNQFPVSLGFEVGAKRSLFSVLKRGA